MGPKPEKWETVKELFEAAQELPTEQVPTFLADKSADPAVRDEVERLLREFRQANDFLSAGAGVFSFVTPSTVSRFAPGELIAGRFRVIDFLAAGGMAEVYKAQDLELHRSVALKFLPEGTETDSGASARLRREAQAASALNHPNICTIYEIGKHQDQTFIAMEFLDGASLKSVIGGQALEIERLLQLGIEIADALDAAHAESIIHRDIKPANVFVTKRGHAKVLDFGLAKLSDREPAGEVEVEAAIRNGVWSQELTSPGTRPGTVAYMSPEQVRGLALDTRTDIFSFGALLYEMATGVLPFQGADIRELCRAILTDAPVSPASRNSLVTAELENLILRSLEKDRDKRCQQAAEIRAELQRMKRVLESGAATGFGQANDAGSTPKRYGVGPLRLTRASWFSILLLLAMVFAGYWGVRWRRGSATKLTDKDTIVLADFVNTTSEGVFDDALKEGLAADLGQSTFLNVLSESAVGRQLQLMGRPRDSRLTPEVAREVCRRENSKIMLLGSIANLGSHYVITVKAVNCEDGDFLQVEQVEADRRERVLGKLHQAAEAIRSKLGESLASIQQHDIPLFQDTTSSLEALEAYGLAMKTWRTKGESAALPLFKRAVELDPNFAIANAGLGIVYSNLGQAALSADYVVRAYKLRDRVSEWERLSIDSAYYLNVTGEQEKAIEVNERWKQIYPRALAPLINLGITYSNLGRSEKALAEDQEALQLAPNTFRVYSNLSYDYMSLDRLPEAKATLQEAHTRNLDGSMVPSYYQLAFLQGDTQEMERLLAKARGTDNEDSLLALQADTEAYHGHLKSARNISEKAIQSALRSEAKDTAADWQVSAALREAEFGNTQQARRRADAALKLAATPEVQIAAAIALARSGDVGHAESLAQSLHQHYPTDTLLNNYWLPSLRAAIALQRRDPQHAISDLRTPAAYELGGGRPPFFFQATMYPAYLRGEALAAMQKWREAAAEFQNIVAHRGLVGNFALADLAQLQLARACKRGGDRVRAREAYSNFLTLWQRADEDLPILREAKTEAANLQ